MGESAAPSVRESLPALFQTFHVWLDSLAVLPSKINFSDTLFIDMGNSDPSAEANGNVGSFFEPTHFPKVRFHGGKA